MCGILSSSEYLFNYTIILEDHWIEVRDFVSGSEQYHGVYVLSWDFKELQANQNQDDDVIRKEP